jgi:hypothetical protein
MNNRSLPTVFVILLCILSSSLKVQAQNHIIMINGTTIEAASYSVNAEYVTYRKPGSVAKSPKMIDRYDVFEIIKADSSEEMIYQSDSLDFTVAEVRQYIKGEQAAHLYYRRPANMIGAAVVGLGAGVLSFYSLPVPMIYSVIAGRFNCHKIEVRNCEPIVYNVSNEKFQTPRATTTVYDESLVKSEPFISGYQKTARNMKIQQSLKWGYISLGVSLAALIAYGYSVH